MDSNQFSTTNTNYQGIDFDTSTSIAKGIDSTIASNNQQYKQMAQNAIAAAETKSRNFQKLGELVAQTGKFVPKFREWQDNRSILKAKRAEVENQQSAADAAKAKNTELYNGTGSVSFDQKFDESFTKAVYKNKESEKFQSIFEESNANTVEGMQLAWQTDQDYTATGNIDLLEDSVYLNQSLAVQDYETQGKALVQNVGDSYKGYSLANYDTKVPVEGFGNVSLADADAANNGAGNPAMYNGVQQFLNESFFYNAQVFSGKNKMSNRHLLELIKNTDATDNAARAQFLQQSAAKSKKQYETKRRIDLANSIKTDPVGTIFGNTSDPNSGYIKQAEKMSGKKDTALAFEMLREDLTWAVDNGYLKADGLNKIISMQDIPARDGSGSKSLQELKPQFYEAVQVLFDKAAAAETKRDELMKANKVTSKVKEATERLKTIEGGATEADLLAEVNNMKEELNNEGIIVAEDNNNKYWSYFQPLTAYVTNEDKLDIDTVKFIDHDLLEGDFDNARARLDEINDPTLRTKYEKKIKGHDVIEQNKDQYKAIETRLSADVAQELNNKLATANKEMKVSVIIDNVKDDLRKKFLFYTSKQGGALPPDQALDRAEQDILGNVKAVDVQGKDRTGARAYGDYYLSGDGKRNLYDANTGRLARDLIQGEDTRNAWFNSQEIHPGEDVEELIQYARGGNIPDFYVEASRGMKFMNSHMIAKMRLEALGYSEESKNLAPSVLNNFDNSVVKNLLFHPSVEKYARIFSDTEGTASLTPQFKERVRNPDYGNSSPFNKEKLEYDNVLIEDIVKEGGLFEQGYGQNGFGSFKLSAVQIEEIRKTSGLDFKTATFTKENQNKLYFAYLMSASEGKNILTGLDMSKYAPSGLSEDDMVDLFDPSVSKFNTPLFTSPDIGDLIYMGSVDDAGNIFYYGDDE